VEVNRVILAELVLVGLVYPPRGLVVEVGCLALGRGHIRQLVLALTDPRQHACRAEALLIEIELTKNLLEERDLVGSVVDGEASTEADCGPFAPKNARADGVEGTDGGVSRLVLPDEAGDPLAHLVGRL